VLGDRATDLDRLPGGAAVLESALLAELGKVPETSRAPLVAGLSEYGWG
jgi:hypothetical protein